MATGPTPMTISIVWPALRKPHPVYTDVEYAARFRRRTEGLFLDKNRGLCGEDFALVETERASQYLGTPVAPWLGLRVLGLELARGLVRFVSQIEEEVEELLRLADEEPVIRETLKR